MAIPHPDNYKSLDGSAHSHPAKHQKLDPAAGNELVTVTLVVRRRPGHSRLRELSDFSPASRAAGPALSHTQFAAAYGADPRELDQVAAFARTHNLVVLETDPARRTVIVRGPVAAINRAFAVELHNYQSPRGHYRGHDGPAALPGDLADRVEAVVGLDNRPVRARHYSSAAGKPSSDPPATKPLTPQQVAQLYGFPPGNGAGQTIGIFEMEVAGVPAGYTAQDLAKTMHAFGMKPPTPVNVSIDGFTSSGVSDPETGLDITVAGAIAPGAEIAVYFTGSDTQSVLHAVQSMIHPRPAEPHPTVISISYGWGPDDASADSFSPQEYTQLDKLFQDAANLSITVLAASGDFGAFIENPARAQASYPATEPWVIACGGTTIGNVQGTAFEEYVWNDIGKAGPRATGGGVSARFPLPDYQKAVRVPQRLGSNQAGRGIPDIAGNASENSGYTQFIDGRPQPIGGTSAVAPLYAGLIARINANLGHSVGFINPLLYSLAASAFRDVAGSHGPANNSFGRVIGYPARAGWDACTGLGSAKGVALQNGLKAAHAAHQGPAAALVVRQH
jgi:kumamolisin